jgi:mRNA interferase MazF
LISSLIREKISTLLPTENPSKIMLKRGDIVLVPFPFTDLSKEKVRPAVVISAENDIDVSVAFISSIIPEEPATVDFVLLESHPDFSVTGLKRASVFKMNKVLTLERSKILRRLGGVSPSIQKELDIRFKLAFGIK